MRKVCTEGSLLSTTTVRLSVCWEHCGLFNLIFMWEEMQLLILLQQGQEPLVKGTHRGTP